MGLMENVRLAISSLKANKLRALLTMLGIIIGIASVITIVTIGDSLAASIIEKKFIQNMKRLQKRILLQMK